MVRVRSNAAAIIDSLASTSCVPIGDFYEPPPPSPADEKHTYIQTAVPLQLLKATHHSECQMQLPKCVPRSDSTSRSAGAARNSTLPGMSRMIQVVQLNVRKRDMVHESLMHDKRLQDFEVFKGRQLTKGIS
jgi:hypothetical protein